jgi:CheY-like chemotaxis protein
MVSSEMHHILLVEDDPNDVFLMERALAKTNLGLPMHVVMNGQQAIEYLAGEGKYIDRVSFPLPQHLFLDLKMPFVNGFEVMEWLRERASLSPMDVFVLSSSPEDRDRERSRRLGAKAYLVKPPTPQMLIEVLSPAVSNPE